MNDDVKVSVKSGGLGLCSILTIIFIVLKAFGVIHFTWFQCFLPLIIGWGFALILLIIAIIIIAIKD